VEPQHGRCSGSRCRRAGLQPRCASHAPPGTSRLLAPCQGADDGGTQPDGSACTPAVTEVCGRRTGAGRYFRLGFLSRRVQACSACTSASPSCQYHHQPASHPHPHLGAAQTHAHKPANRCHECGRGRQVSGPATSPTAEEALCGRRALGKHLDLPMGGNQHPRTRCKNLLTAHSPYEPPENPLQAKPLPFCGSC